MRLQPDAVRVLELLAQYNSFDEIVLAVKLGFADGPWVVHLEHKPIRLIRFERMGYWGTPMLLLWYDMRVESGLARTLGSSPKAALQNHLSSGGSL